MIHGHPKIVGAAILAVAAVAAMSLLVSACLGPGCQLGCNSDDAYLTLPETPDAGIERIVTNPPCIAGPASVDSDETQVLVRLFGGGTCDVVVRLTNGDVYEASVQFQSVDTHSCCGTVTRLVDASAPQLVATADGGVD